MSVILEPIQVKRKTAWELAKEKRKTLPLPLRILTSPVTTVALATTLAGLLYPPGAVAVGKMLIPKTLKGALITGVTVPTAAGVLIGSEKARKMVKTTLDPRESIKRGKKIGEIIEDPKRTADILGIEEHMPTKEKLKAGLKAAGKVGLVAAGVGAVIGAAKKIIPKIKEKRAAKKLAEPEQLEPGMKAMGFVEPQPVGIGGVPIKPSVITPSEPSGEEIKQPAVSNIIQIQVH